MQAGLKSQRFPQNFNSLLTGLEQELANGSLFNSVSLLYI